jgi:hypothetical protein
MHNVILIVFVDKFFGKNRVKSMRDERDLLMTNLGAMMVSAQNKSSEFDDVVRRNKVLSAAVKAKNTIDHTTALIATPGYFEAVGPERIYQSVWNQDQVPLDEFNDAVSMIALYSSTVGVTYSMYID